MATGFFLSVPIMAQTYLDPLKPRNDLGYYEKKDSKLSNGETYGFYGWGSVNPAGDLTPEFYPLNFDITPERPYLEWKTINFDHDDDSNDYSYANELWVQYEGTSSYVRVAHARIRSHDLKNVDITTHGVLVRRKMDSGANESELDTYRYYPRDLNKKINKIMVVGHYLLNNSNGKHHPNTEPYRDMLVHGIWVWTLPVKYDFSALDGKAVFTEAPGGTVSFTITDLPTRAVGSVDNTDWRIHVHQELKDRDVIWYNNGISVKQIDGYNKTVTSTTYSWNNSGGKANASGSFSNAIYGEGRNYVAVYNLARRFTTGTNGYDANNKHEVYQRFTYEAKEKSSNRVGYASPKANSVKAAADMWNKKMLITWQHRYNNADMAGKWYVFRYKKGDTSSRILLTTSGLPASTLQYEDRDVPEYDTYYVYEVSFFPTVFGEISQPEPSLTGTVEGMVNRECNMTLSTQSLERNGVSDGIELTWKHAPVLDPNVQFEMWRRESSAADYVKIATVSRQNAEVQQHTYIDRDASSPCAVYQYKITAVVKEREFASNEVTGTIVGGSRVRSITASKGTYGKTVRVQWEVQQVGSANTKFELSRRLLGGDGTFTRIYTTEGTATNYQYEDNTVHPGNFYEYKVDAYSICDAIEGSLNLSNTMFSDGFSQSTGLISGRITYGTGTAVEGVKVVLTRSNDEYNTKNQFYALESKSNLSAISYDMDADFVSSLFGSGNTATYQMWVNPLSLCTDPTFIRTKWFKFYGRLDATKSFYTLKFHTYYNNAGVLTAAHNVTIPANSYSHLTLAMSASKVSLRIIDETGEMREWSADINIPAADFTSGSYLYFAGENAEGASMLGLIDEVRLWGKDLTDAEVKGNYDRLLAGTEKGLKLYWPIDEGIKDQATAYDYSKTDDVPNERHGVIAQGSAISTQVPAESQLSLYGITDAAGNYTIRGVPFSGEGTNYIVTPIMGVHEFSPRYLTRYVSANSLTHSGTDMEDVSSFEVSGTVYYENTLYPVEGAYLYVDGMMANRDGDPIMTDENGNYTISVPIGDHFVSVEKSGHSFVDDGRYPVDKNKTGLRHTFNQEVSNLTFYDNTLVTVVGRVTGGEVEGSKPLGLGGSKNTIGKATIELSTGREMNVALQINGGTYSYEPQTQDRTIATAAPDVNSTGYYKGGDNMEEVKRIFIQTDPATGEFAALLPPLLYKVESITVDSNPSLMFGNLSSIDATNTQMTTTDSLEVDGVMRSLEYNASMVATYRVEPSFTVTDKTAEEGAFGEKTVTIKERLTTGPGADIVLPIYTTTGGAVSYNYGKPIFTQGNKYTLKLKGFEEYVNNDGERPESTLVPLSDVTVTIKNELSANQQVRGANDSSDPAAVVNLKENQLKLDENGEYEYTFSAGFPNTVEDQGFARSLNITYNVNGQELAWSGNGTFKGVILGALPSGTNFVTAGPTKIDMVLRDPPGSNSSATWSKGHSISSTVSNAGTWTSDTNWETVFRCGIATTTLQGSPIFGVISESAFTNEKVGGAHLLIEGNSGTSTTTTFTLTQDISTSDSPDYVGADGDIFVGHSSNTLFGDARSVTFVKGLNGTYALGSETAKITSEQFSTIFQYTQYYIKNTLIPNLRSLRNSMIRTVSESEYSGTVVNNSSSPIYITTLTPSDANFGSSKEDDKGNKNYKVILPGTLPTEYVYDDSVMWYNNQIKAWEDALKANEESKVTAIESRDEWLEDNLSFDAGTTIVRTVEYDTITTDVTESSEQLVGTLYFRFGATAFGGSVGTLNQIGTETGGGYERMEEDATENSKAFSYTLSVDGSGALTVDVFKAPDKFGPIFVTRGGQTAGPYEGETVTEYHRPGTSISAATMQIEVPSITVDNPSATNVPAGGAATFALKLANLSEVNEDVWFDLALVDETNANGAKLSIDGAVLTDGRAMLVKAGETLTKTLLLEQTDQSVLDYEDVKLVLKAQSQGDPTSIRGAIADTVAISAYFVPSCSDISLRAESRTINTASTPAGTLLLKVADINRSYRSFKGFRVEYRYANDPKWTVFHTYLMDANDSRIMQSPANYSVVPNTGVIDVNVDMNNSNIYPDGQYVFRAVTMCEFGTGEVNNESNEIEVIKDMARPQILGTPNPADGILNAGEDIFVTFNEDIRNGALAQDLNFIVTGVLNGAQVDHNTTLQLNGTSTASASTEADILLARQSFAVDFWINVSGSGILFEHGAGSNKFRVGIDTSGRLTVGIAGNNYVSANTVPRSKWAFVSLCYEYAQGASLLNAQVATDDQTTNLFLKKPVADYNGIGRIAVGTGLTGSIHELTLWNRARSLSESQGEMYATKVPSTPNLIGYWKMDDGHGTVIRDYARNRHMKSEGNWALNNENFSAAFNGTSSYAELDLSRCSMRPTDSYAFEFWFKGGAQANASLFSVSTDLLVLRTNAAGKLCLVTNGEEKQIGTANYLDGQWHHFALNVLRTGLGQVYIDGANVAQYPAAAIPSMAGDAISLGALRSLNPDASAGAVYQRSQYFKGEIDEVRLWNAALTASVLDANRYSRIDTNMVAGLVAYYPFETRALDSNLQLVTTFSLDDMSQSKMPSKASASVVKGATAPGLKEALTATNLQFSYTASERQVFVKLNEAANRLEGTTVNISLRNVLDMNNNVMNTATWTAFISQNRLKWGEPEVSVERSQGDTPSTFSVTISNTGSADEQWTISNIPSWLTVSGTQGSLRPLADKRLTFTISDATPAGKYEETIYLSGNDGIYEPLVVSLKVTAGKPKWTVNPADYELSMNMVGQLKVDNIVTDDPDDIIAAFIDEECVGMASPVYYSRYDAYYVHLSVYGNDEHLTKPVTFKMWDASTGDTYPQVAVSQPATFVSNKVSGSMNAPVVWNAKEQREQAMSMEKGWNWISLYVNPETDAASLNDIFGKNIESFSTIKSEDKFASPLDGSWIGTIGNMAVGKLYKVQVADGIDMSIYGKAVIATNHPVAIAPGWNWIGFNSNARMTVDDAFADLAPTTGDVVKSQHAFSVYEDYQWVGTLATLVPGQGYMYQSTAASGKSFTYPSAHITRSATGGPSRVLAMPTRASGQSSASFVQENQKNLTPDVFTPVDIHKYPGTMTMIANVVKDGVVRNDVEVGAFVDNECRGAIKAMDSGHVFLSIFGEMAKEHIILKVYLDGEIYTIDQNLLYQEDNMLGTTTEPYLISVDMSTIPLLPFVEGETRVYNLQGVYLGTSLSSLADGFYIVNGKKAIVINGRLAGNGM